MNEKPSQTQKYWSKWNDENGIKLLTYKLVATKYDSNYWSADGEWFRDRAFPKITEEYSEARSIADIGAGTGRLMSLWSYLNLNAVGFEWSDCLLEILKEESDRFDFSSAPLDLIEASTRQKFDIVFSSQLFLHIPPKMVYSAMNNFLSSTRNFAVIVSYSDEVVGFDQYANPESSGLSVEEVAKSTYNYNYEDLFRELGVEVVLRDKIIFHEKPVERTPLNPPAQNMAWVLRN